MSYDLVVIGAGPGGYVCAIRAAQLGMRVAVVEKEKTFGGTCLNIGCIPSKALLHASELFEDAGHTFGKLGITIHPPNLDLPAMMRFKDEAVDGNVKGVAYLLRKNKIDTHTGTGRIAAPGRVEVTGAAGPPVTLEARAIVIATGSAPAPLRGVTIDEQRIVSSTGALSLAKVPQRLLVVGAGVIGLELGSVWRRLGANVTVVEFQERIVPGVDLEVARQYQRLLEKQGVAFRLGTKVAGVDAAGQVLKVRLEPAAARADAAEAKMAEAKPDEVETDVALIAIGRVPYTRSLGLEALGLALDRSGRIPVDGHFATAVPGVYAIGDVIAGPMLAHKAEDEGIAVAEMLAGKAGHVNYDVIPGVIYTMPEVAFVGRTEEELREAGVAYRTGKFPFTANGRAKANQQTDGFVKILADAATDRVLGVHIIGTDAGNMIAQAATAMELGASAEDIARTCHAHPTLPEAVKEAALAVDSRAIHL